MTLPTPCPICAAPYGFHDDEPHERAAARVYLFAPVRQSNSAVRRERRRVRSADGAQP
jgi:hypothetical protein